MNRSVDDTPLITIITATYNAAAHLAGSIDSVLRQTYLNFEYIVIDGASSDGTLDILKMHNKQITYWLTEPDTGIYDAWNKGIKKANGAWILFLGADDQLLPDALESYVKFINQNSAQGFDYISSKVKRVRPNGTVEGIVGKPWKWNDFKYRMTTAHPGSFHSKRLFSRFGNFSTSYQIVSDYEMLLRAGKDLRAGYFDKITVLMSTGGRFADFNSTNECLKMFAANKHLTSAEHFYIYTYLSLRKFYLKIIKRFRNKS